MNQFDICILRDIPIASVARDLGLECKGRGVWLSALCPWHEDKSPSLKINTRTNTCHCFACGKGGSPIDLVMQVEGLEFRDACAWLCQNYGVGQMDSAAPLVPRLGPRHLPREEVPLTCFGMDVALGFQSAESNFCRCMRHYFSEETVQRVVELYHLGATEEGDVMFPTIDREGRVRDFKIQRYCTDPEHETFFHSEHSKIRWWGGLLQKQGKLSADAHLDRNCLFGEHLLGRNSGATVVLVESPKNAVVGAAALPDFLWVAAGNKGMLRRSILEPLAGRRVIVMPDCDAYEEWKSIIEELQDLAHFTMSSFQEIALASGNKKYDVADFILMHN